ncbi:MAG: hypothetical protein ACON4T_01535 [Synechococcus sp.]
MKQLPGQTRPRWLQQLIGLGVALMVSVWLLSLLPVLLIVGLVAGVLLLPVLRELRRELERLDPHQADQSGRPADGLRNATPWQQKLRNWMRFERRFR